MGYYTDYTITTDKAIPEDFDEKFEQITDYSIYDMELLNVKWYDHKDDMLKISKEYPDILFTVDGDGEDQGDVWREYYKNGRMQRVEPKVIWPEFDEDKFASDKTYI